MKSGCGIHVCDGRAIHVSRGSVIYLKDEDVHCFDHMDNLCLTNVLFMPDEFHSSPHLTSLLTESCRSDSGQMMVCPQIQQQAELWRFSLYVLANTFIPPNNHDFASLRRCSFTRNHAK